jgi:hypothetical protein
MAILEENHILVGLGGTGGNILRAFKMRMFEEFPNAEERNNLPIALLYVDSTREKMGIGRPDMDVLGQDASFGENEFLNIKGCDVPELLDNVDNHPEIRGIVQNVGAVRTAIGNLGEAAGQKRRAGRLLFAVNARRYVNALKNCYAACNVRSKKEKKTVHIFAGLCGGTGSGAIIDAITQARNIPGWDKAQINVYAMIPEQDLPKPDMDKGRYYENGYAALLELNALQSGQYKPCDVLSGGTPLKLFSDRIKGVANGIALYSNVNANGCTVDSFEELPHIVSDYVYSRIFLINSTEAECHDLIRAFNFENMDGSEFEYDETAPDVDGMRSEELPIVRTKKLYSFGLKRVIYPEQRVLKHMIYTVGQSILYQFKFNNWRANLGYIDEEQNFDYRAEYLKDEVLSRWMLDETHLTLEEEILTAKDGPKYEKFYNWWHNHVLDFADFCNEYEYPLAELSKQMDGMFAEQFREEGVVNYYKTKRHSVIPISLKVRSNIERELFNKWRDGNMSITELRRVGELLANYVATDLKEQLEESIRSNKEKLEESQGILSEITNDWADVGFIGKFVTKKRKDYYTKYQEELAYNLEIRTRLYGLQFAQQLVSELQREIENMSDEIKQFSKMLGDAIDETSRLIAAQRKTNKGLEDMRSAVIEVSEEERMMKYEEDLRFDKEGMGSMTRQLRESILPNTEFKSFGDLLTHIRVQDIKHAFDKDLSRIIQEKHAELPVTATKVLGLNILTQLQQKLGDNRQKIQEFARDILQQSGAYINLDRNQIIMNVRNNAQPDETKNINLREVLISIPSPDDNENLKAFAESLKEAFESQGENGVKKPKIFMKSSRKNELSIITINYAFPMRAISWLAGYKNRYEKLLHTGNKNTDLTNAILLHGEGLGESLPDLFAKSNVELEKEAPMPPMPGVAMPPTAAPTVQLFVFVGGQQYGPYDWATCQQLVPTGQLTAQTLVWEQGMAAWTPAGQVPKLQALFAPTAPMPPMPPSPPSMVPPVQ